MQTRRLGRQLAMAASLLAIVLVVIVVIYLFGPGGVLVGRHSAPP
jgi:hypothetical protein